MKKVVKRYLFQLQRSLDTDEVDEGKEMSCVPIFDSGDVRHYGIQQLARNWREQLEKKYIQSPVA